MAALCTVEIIVLTKFAQTQTTVSIFKTAFVVAPAATARGVSMVRFAMMTHTQNYKVKPIIATLSCLIIM